MYLEAPVRAQVDAVPEKAVADVQDTVSVEVFGIRTASSGVGSATARAIDFALPAEASFCAPNYWCCPFP